MNIYVPITELGYLDVTNEEHSSVPFLCWSNWPDDCWLQSNDYLVMSMSQHAAETLTTRMSG